MLKSPTGMVTSPAVRPWLSVLITVCAITGRTAAAKPEPRAVCTKSRRVKSRVGVRLSRSERSMRYSFGGGRLGGRGNGRRGGVAHSRKEAAFLHRPLCRRGWGGEPPHGGRGEPGRRRL